MTMSEVDHTGLDREEAITRVAEIQQAILVLPEAEYALLRKWLSDLDWERWDRQIQADSDEGALDFLVSEALEAKEDDALQEF